MSLFFPQTKIPEVEYPKGMSREYIDFLIQEQRSRELHGWFEKYCRFAETLKMKPPKSLEEKYMLDIVFADLNATPTGVFSAALMTLLIFGIIFIPATLLFADISTLVFVAVVPLAFFWFIFTYPSFKAHVVRIQAGDEAIKVILYMVIYLKLNPSFEGAVNFAVAHSKGPITRDIKKAMWDLELGKYNTVEEALSTYTNKWAWWNEDFIRSISLLYGVLIEPTETGREEILKKALGFILESTHLKMKRYVEEVSSPIMLLHTMGLLLPAIGLIMFPMLSIFLSQSVSIPQLIIGYIIVLPLMNLFFVIRILQKRPGAFLVPDISKHPELPPEDFFEIKMGTTKILVPIMILAVLAGFLTMTYGIFHFVDLAGSLINLPPGKPREPILLQEATMTPTNLAATFSITGGVAVAIILFFYLRSFQRVKIRNEIKNIEGEFQIGLFSLGNFLSEGYPIEVGMQKSLEEYDKLGMQKRPIYAFFQRLFYNIKQFSMTFKRALYDREYGLLKYYPSVLIDEIMKILSDASEKSAILLGTIAKTVANYLDNVNAIEAKIRELLDETRSSIRMQATFVIPLITGIIGALGIFILNMLRILAEKLAEIEKNLGFQIITEAGQGATSFINLLVGDFTKIVPMTVLQAVVGVYTVEVVSLFAMLLSGIENGFDNVARDWEIAQTLMRAILVYGVVNLFALIIFNGIAQTVSTTTS